VQVVSPEGGALGYVTMDDLLVARLHDPNEDTLRTRHFVAFGRQRPVVGDAAPELPPLD
jgi:chloride channel protein, CIC family